MIKQKRRAIKKPIIQKVVETEKQKMTSEHCCLLCHQILSLTNSTHLLQEKKSTDAFIFQNIAQIWDSL